MITLAINNQTIEIELIEAEAAFGDIESECGLVGRSPTVQLLDAVAAWLALRGVDGCSRSVAWQVWWAIYERIDCIRKATQTDAEIAYWFHVDPFSMTDEQRLGLLANLPRVKAQAALADGKFNGTDYNYVYHLTLLATGDEKQAQSAKADALERYVDAKMGSN